MYNPLTFELMQSRQAEMQRQAEAQRQSVITSQNSLSNTMNTVFNALTRHIKQSAKVEGTARRAWLADQA